MKYILPCFTSLERLHVSRTKRELSVAKTSQSKGDTNSAKQINLEHEEKEDDDPEEDNIYRDTVKEKHKAEDISRKVADSTISDFSLSNVEGSFDRDDASSNFNSRHSNEATPEEADQEAMQRDKSEKANNLVRLPRNVNSNFDRYIDEDERSSLYDDYEAKDVAKRGILNGSEDYEEIEDDSPGISEEIAAVQESTNKAEKRETRQDARVKRDQAEISEMLDMSKPSPAKLEESKTKDPAKNSYSRQASRVELLKGFNEMSTPDDVQSKMKDFGSKDAISKLSDSSKIQEPANRVTWSNKGESNAEYEKRVEEEIQRKIDSLKEEIQRDIEAQQRIRDIEDNNAKFDELQDQEQEDEERQNFKDKSIEKRQTIAKRSIRKIDDTVGSYKKEPSLRKELHEKRQRQSNRIDKSDTLKKNENLKKRFVINYNKSFEQIPSNGLLKKKCERARQIFLRNTDQHQTKKRQSRSYTLPSDRIAVGSENELFINPDSNSYLHTNNKMLEKSLPIDGEDTNNEGEQSPTAEHSDSLVSLIGSSQELNPRLEKEYKEAFGGLQSEPGSALARFKRIKRVLNGPNAKISNFC